MKNFLNGIWGKKKRKVENELNNVNYNQIRVVRLFEN